MYVAPTKNLVTIAMQSVFDADYPIEQFQSLHVSIEFPNEKQHYPGIWTDFNPTAAATNIGIGHEEFHVKGTEMIRFKRWIFQGLITYTVCALTSLERDMLHDELVRVFAFGAEHPALNDFRESIENSEHIAIDVGYDEVTSGGWSAVQGTPWGGDEVIYECTLSLGCKGEFFSDGETMSLLRLEDVEVFPYVEGTPDPKPEGTWLGNVTVDPDD